MTGTLIERLWESDEASRLTNEAARTLEVRDKTIAKLLGALSDMKTLIDQKHDSADMVDGGDLRYWSQLIEFAIRRAEGNE